MSEEKSQDTQESIEETPAEEEVQSPSQETQEDPVDAYRKIQSEKDRIAEEARLKAEENQRLKEQLKDKLDKEEREKFEMAEQLSRERANREQLEKKVQQQENNSMKERIFSENPELKVFNEDLDFSGMDYDEAKEYAKETVKQLDKYVELRQESKKKESLDAPPAESSKASAGDVKSVSVDKFKGLTRKDREKILKAKGLL